MYRFPDPPNGYNGFGGILNPYPYGLDYTMPLGGRAPWQEKKRRGALYVVVVLQTIGIILLTASLFAPAYHDVHVLVMGNSLSIQVGLFKVQTETRCLTQFLPKIGAKIKPLCDMVQNTLNGASLSTFENYACLSRQLFIEIFPAACDAISRLQFSSFILAFSLLVSLLLYAFGCLMLGVFWNGQKKIKTRMAAVFAQSMASLIMLLGITFYVIGGGVAIDMSNSFFMIETSTFDLSWGFVLACISCIWTMITPFMMLLAMPKKVCSDSRKFLQARNYANYTY